MSRVPGVEKPGVSLAGVLFGVHLVGNPGK